jgi:2,4-dienoyl-CoA reductase-like NADH-dependent reductase (Old Yellow Enzyme family)
MSKLFSPLTIKNIHFKNRLVISPMCQYSSEDGFANDWHLVHLGSRAVGGAALIMQEATAILPEGRITYGDMGLWKDEQIPKLQEIVSFIHSQGALCGIQLAHAGRKASCTKPWEGGHQIPPDQPNGWQTLSASSQPFREKDLFPHALTPADIRELIAAYVAAVRRCQKIGYDVLEIHAAHGYLMHQFYSPLSNARKDDYGGSFENRARLLLEITEAVKSAWGDEKAFFVRISASDYTVGGWTIEDSIRLSVMLKDRDVDLIDCSSGGNSFHAKIPLGPGYQVGFAERIKKEAGILTGAVGLITTPHHAEEIIEKGHADLILMARESLRNPYFPLHAAHALKEDIKWPVQYERAKFQ